MGSIPFPCSLSPLLPPSPAPRPSPVTSTTARRSPLSPQALGRPSAQSRSGVGRWLGRVLRGRDANVLLPGLSLDLELRLCSVGHLQGPGFVADRPSSSHSGLVSELGRDFPFPFLSLVHSLPAHPSHGPSPALADDEGGGRARASGFVLDRLPGPSGRCRCRVRSSFSSSFFVVSSSFFLLCSPPPPGSVRRAGRFTRGKHRITGGADYVAPAW